MDEKEKLMKSEIKKRIESSEWDIGIAAAVLKKKRRKKIAYSVSFSSLAAAALVLIVLLFGIYSDPYQDTYDSFISNQVNGTYKLVFNGNSGIDSNNDNMLLSNDIDNMIDNTLSMR